MLRSSLRYVSNLRAVAPDNGGIGALVLIALLLASGSGCWAAPVLAASGGGYHLLRTLPVPGETGWDYLKVDPVARRLYLSSNSGIIIFNIDTEKFVGTFPRRPFRHGVGFVHGVAIARLFHRGFVSHEVPPSVLIFNLNTLAPLGVTRTDPGTDAVIYDPASRHVFTFNGKTPPVHDATVIDAATGRRIGDIPLPGVPEFPGVDGTGNLYDNIVSKNEMVRINTHTLKITATWPMAPCRRPSALAIDVVHHRAFVGCDNQLMAMVDLNSGKVLATVPIGAGVDAARFDPGTDDAFASAGAGTLTIAHEDSPDKLTVTQVVKTAPSARTMALDPLTHRVFLLAAKFAAPPKKATPDNPHRYPVVAGTARLLILGP